MSEIRRKLLIASSMGGDGSWYRICKGGIYTTTSAYIDTGYKNFTNRNFEFWVDCKVLTEETNGRWLTGAISGGAFNTIVFVGSVTDKYYPNIFKGAHETQTYHVQNIGNARPFINVRTKITQPFNDGNVMLYVQKFENGEWGNKIYANNAVVERMNYQTLYPMYIFCGNIDSSSPAYNGNNITIYETGGKQKETFIYHMIACQLIQNISAELASDNKPHQSGEYGMYDEVSGKFFGNASSTGYFLENID